MSGTEGIENVLSLGRVRYLVVRPHRGMRDGYEVVNAWNEDQIASFGPDSLEEAVEHAREYAAYSSSFDHVLVVREPATEEEVEN